MKSYSRIAVVLSLLIIALFMTAAQAEGTAVLDKTMEALTLTDEAIEDLAFLSSYTNLRSLTLIDCPIVDLAPLALCKQLTTLTILWHDEYTNTGVYDLTPLSQCARLSSLTLAGACVNDLTPLKNIKKITTLSVQSLGDIDYTPISTMGLKHLLLSGAPGEQVAGIFSAIGRKLESAAVGDCTLTQEANDAIQSCTRLLSLRFHNTQRIDTGINGWKKLKELTTLSISHSALSDLRFLSSYVSTVIVKLDDIQLGGVSCSVDFDKYFLKTNNVPSEALLDFLEGTGRRWLYATIHMETGSVSKEVIAALAGIGSLLSLDVQAIAPDAFTQDTWNGFPKLEQLKLSGSEITTSEFLNQLKVLKRLTISNSDLFQSETIPNRYALKQLSLISCDVDDWGFLDKLNDLELLSIAGCNGPNVLPFAAAMPKLQTLALEDAPVMDISPLEGHPLRFLYLYGCPIADYTPLATLPSLYLLVCNEDAQLPQLGCHVRHQNYINLRE